MQAGLLKRRWKLNVRGPVDVRGSFNPRPQPASSTRPNTHICMRTCTCPHAHTNRLCTCTCAWSLALCLSASRARYFFSLCHSLLPLCLLNAARGFAWRIAPRGFGIAGSPRHTRRRHTIVAAASPSWAQVNTSDFFLHKKFFELPGHVQKRMGLRDCSGDTTLAVGRCYMIANAV